MDLNAQQKRRAPITYGRLMLNRRKIPTSLGDELENGGDLLSCGGKTSPPNIQDSLSTSNKSAESNGSKPPESQLKLHKISKPAPSRNTKYGLERANSASKIDIADQKVFDVPSSDEDAPKPKRTLRRALSSSQKRFGSSHLEENRIPSAGRSERTTEDKEETMAPRPMVSLGQTVTKIQSTAMKKTVDRQSDIIQTTYSRTKSKTSITGRAGIQAIGPKQPREDPVVGVSSTGGVSRATPSHSVWTGEKHRRWENPKGCGRAESEGTTILERKQPQEGSPVAMEISRTGEKLDAEATSKLFPAVSTVADVRPVQRRPRKQRQLKSLPNKPEQQLSAEFAQPARVKPEKPVARGNSKLPAQQPSESPTLIKPLYISSPVLGTQEPVGAPIESLTATYSPLGEPSLWDDIMGGTAFEGKPIGRKLKRSRETETVEREITRGPTPPRRRRLIDTLEVDWTVSRPKQGTLGTEMDIDDDSESGDDTPMISLTDSQPLTESQETDEVEDAAQAFQRGLGLVPSAPELPQRNARVTYSRQRSFLTEEVKEGGDPFADPLLLPVRDLGRGVRKAPIVEEEDDEDHGPGMMKSLHELREAGVNKRFLDNVEGYFEDIERNFSIGQKRVGYIELATKLRDKGFLQKFRANNFERRLLKDFGKQDDEIVRFALCFIVWTFLEEDTSSQIIQLVHKKGIISMLDGMMDSTRDMTHIAKDKKTNMTKAAQSLLLEFCDTIKSSKIFGGKAPMALSPQILALAVLDSVMKGLRRAGFMGDCLSTAVLRRLVRVLEPFQVVTSLEKRKQVDPMFIELPVSILESYSIGRDSTQNVQFSEEDLDILANIVPQIMQLEGNDVRPIQLLVLRLHINLTNHRPAICDILGKPAVIKALVLTTNSTFEGLAGPLEEEARLIQLDMLVLSLALMINFAENSDSSRLPFVEGPYATSQLAVLLKLFLAKMERAAEADSMEETQSNVAFGYLSILLGNLCQNATVRNVIRGQMPKKSLEPLVNAVQEFVSHNQKVDEERRALTGGEGEAWHSGFTERLEQVAIRLKAARDVFP